MRRVYPIARWIERQERHRLPLRQGATTVEYGVMLMTVLAVVFGMLVLLGNRTGWLWSQNSAQLEPALRGGGVSGQEIPGQTGNGSGSAGSHSDPNAPGTSQMNQPSSPNSEGPTEAEGGSVPPGSDPGQTGSGSSRGGRGRGRSHRPR
jgi:Flp pilus assembly pilin Flp